MAGITLAMVAVVGCTAVSVDESDAENPSPSSTHTHADPDEPATVDESQYDAAVSTFPLTLPAGMTFPELRPDGGGWALMPTTGKKVVYQWWACATLAEAWSRADAGDTSVADTLVQSIDQAKDIYPDYFSGWDQPRVFRWSDTNERSGGDSGLCSAWFERLADED